MHTCISFTMNELREYEPRSPPTLALTGEATTFNHEMVKCQQMQYALDIDGLANLPDGNRTYGNRSNVSDRGR